MGCPLRCSSPIKSAVLTRWFLRVWKSSRSRSLYAFKGVNQATGIEAREAGNRLAKHLRRELVELADAKPFDLPGQLLQIGHLLRGWATAGLAVPVAVAVAVPIRWGRRLVGRCVRLAVGADPVAARLAFLPGQFLVKAKER